MSRPLRQGSAEARALYELMTNAPEVLLGDTGGPDPMLVALRIVQRLVAERWWPMHVSVVMDDLSGLDPWVATIRRYLDECGEVAWVARDDTPGVVKLLVGRLGTAQWELHFQSLKSREASVADFTIIDPRLVTGRVRPAPSAIAGQILRLGRTRLKYTFGRRPFTGSVEIPVDILLAGAPS